MDDITLNEKDIILAKALSLVEKLSKQRKYDDYTDYQKMMEKLEIFEQGRQYERSGIYPTFFNKKFIEDAELLLDSEYDEYLRLKKKFEGMLYY